MSTKEAISILRSNCSRLIQIVDNREMNRIYDATEKAIRALQFQGEMEKEGEKRGK